MSTVSTFRRCAAAALSMVVALGGPLLLPSPAAAAGVGYIRLAHLVPDGIKCDMYIQLDKIDGDVLKKLSSIEYGTLSEYEPLPVGTYAVTMRKPGSPAESAPVLATSITVEEGRAYTAARMGAPNLAQARVFPDDRTLPPGNTAKLRVVQAAQRTIDVAVVDGPTVGTAVGFTTVTDYTEVEPGARTLRIQPAAGQPFTVRADLVGGAVYSVLVLEGTDGAVSAKVRTDAKREGRVPTGGVATGGGGTWRERAEPAGMLVAVLLPVLLLTAGLVVRRARRLPATRR